MGPLEHKPEIYIVGFALGFIAASFAAGAILFVLGLLK